MMKSSEAKYCQIGLPRSSLRNQGTRSNPNVNQVRWVEGVEDPGSVPVETAAAAPTIGPPKSISQVPRRSAERIHRPRVLSLFLTFVVWPF